jgi:hypothetical protein
MAHPRRPDGFLTVLIDPDGVVLDRKSFRAYGDAVKHVTEDGLDAVDGEVARSEIWSPDGQLIWSKTDVKVEDQVTAAAAATNRAGLYWHGRPSATEPMPTELFCRRCQKKTAYRTERPLAWSAPEYFCTSCNGRIHYAPWP